MVSTIVETLATRRGVKSCHIRGVKEDANTGLSQMANNLKSCEPKKEKEPKLELFIVRKFIFTTSQVKAETETA